MRHLFIALFLFSIAVISNSCESNDKSAKTHSEPAITFSLKNFEGNHIYMYSCRGTRQMLIDSLPIVDGFSSVFIPRETPHGIYRFVIDSTPIDLIISNENISVNLDAQREKEPIRIVESKENKCFYDFIYEYSAASTREEISCDEVSDLRSKYLNDTIPAKARAFIQLILASDSCLNEEICLNEMLLNCPYTSSIIQAVTANRCKNDIAGNILQKIEQCSDTTVATKHELFTAFWDAGIRSAQPEMLNAILKLDDSVLLDAYDKLKGADGIQCIEAGSTFPIQRLIKGFSTGIYNLYYIIIHDGQELSQSPELLSLTNYLDINKDKYFTISNLELSEDIKREIGYVTGPMAFMIGKNDVLADKWVGYRDIRTIK